MQSKWLFYVSLALLLLLAGSIAFLSTNSAMAALGRGPDQLAPGYSIAQLTTVSPEAADATRGRRVTASAWALGYALLLAALVLVPYRRGERWAWYAVLVSMVVPQLLSLARIPMLGTVLGASTSYVLLSIVGLALAAGAPRMFAKRPLPAE
jgi:hypothetical protein